MIDGATTAAMVGIAGALILAVAALRRRRIGGRSLTMLALIWIGIIALLRAVASLGLGFGRTSFT